MFEIEKLYKAAHESTQPDISGFVEYMKSFKSIIVWGAGYLGDDVGKKLIELSINITKYWDIRAAELHTLNKITIEKPFGQKYHPETTIFVFCITNCFVRDRLKEELTSAGYQNVLIGEFLYQGLICPINDYDGFKTCRDSLACDAFTCIRNEHFFLKSLFDENKIPEDILTFRNLTVVINQKCTLQCKYCYSYTNSYPPKLRMNFPLERIKKDIDIFFDAVDGVKFIPLIGGETFLHPDISAIVKKFLKKKNFGILNVTTNGIVNIKPEQLDGFQNDRVQVVFSNYKECLSPQQNDLYDKNVEFVKSLGIRVIESNTTPTWVMPTTLDNKNYSIEMMKNKRAACFNPLSCKYLKNGKFYPCTIADSIHNLRVADYNSDYIDLDAPSDRNQLRKQIADLSQKEYYQSCAHCDGSCGQMGLVSKAGEQGFHEFVNI